MNGKEDCFVCGRPAVMRAKVEGAIVWVCPGCAHYGKPMISRSPRRRRPEMPREQKPVEMKENFGAVIRRKRESMKMNQKEFGEFLRMKENEIAGFEEQKIKPSRNQAEKMERVLKVQIIEKEKRESRAEEDKKRAEKEQKELESEEERPRKGGGLTLADIVVMKKKNGD